MYEPMGGPAMIARHPVRGFGGIIATGRGPAFAGLTVASLGLLLVPLLVPFLIFLAAGLMVGDGSLSGGQRADLGLALALATLIIGRFLAPRALLAHRRLTRFTRWLLGRWFGYRVPSAYQPGPSRPGWRPRLEWLATDLATWRDIGWTLLSTVTVWLLAALPALLAGAGLILAGVHPAMDGAFSSILGFPEPGDPDVVYVENHARSLHLEEAPEIERYVRMFSHLVAKALSPEESRRLITDTAGDLRE